MITLLLNSEFTQKFGNEILSVHYLYDPAIISFYLDATEIKFEQFSFKIQRNDKRELLSLQIELKNLSPEKIREICRGFGQDLFSEDFKRFNQIVLRLTLDSQIIERFVKYKFSAIKHLDEIFNLENNRGEKIILNLNNYSIEKVFDL
jgi:hypothetical protein